MSVFVDALALVFQPYVLLVIFASAAFGMFVGAIPGLTATMATALLVPVTFFMDPVPAIAAMLGPRLWWPRRRAPRPTVAPVTTVATR